MAWEPTHHWGGLDGNWSTFSLGIGTPPQHFQALISTNSTALCVPFASSPSTHDAGFHPELSSSWEPKNDTRNEGTDILMVTPSGNSPWRVPTKEFSLDSGSIGTVGVKTLSTYRWGKPSSWFYASPKSFPQLPWTKLPTTLLQSNPLFEYQHVGMAELAYAYTAGAWYRQYPGAFSIGCYDEARASDNASFVLSWMTDDEGHLLKINIESITSDYIISDTKSQQLLPTVIPAVIDSSKPFLELPEETCQDLSKMYNLDYDHDLNLFFVNETTRRDLLILNPNISIVLARYDVKKYPINNNRTMEIVLPFAAFDHQIRLTPDSEPRHYFPIAVANGEQYVLGRVFLQETYLIVNYGFSNDTPPWFIVAQAAFPEPWSDPPKNLTYLFANDDLLKIIYDVWWGWAWLGVVGAAFWLLVIGVLLLCLDFVTAYVLGVPKLRRLRERDQKLKELWMQRHSSEE